MAFHVTSRGKYPERHRSPWNSRCGRGACHRRPDALSHIERRQRKHRWPRPRQARAYRARVQSSSDCWVKMLKNLRAIRLVKVVDHRLVNQIRPAGSQSMCEQYAPSDVRRCVTHWYEPG